MRGAFRAPLESRSHLQASSRAWPQYNRHYSGFQGSAPGEHFHARICVYSLRVASDVLKAAVSFLFDRNSRRETGRRVPYRQLDEKLELALVRRVQQGDDRAFAQLVRAHEDFVFDLVFRLLGDEAEAEDVAQEVFSAV